jgi:hypothetical protein
VWLPPEHSTHRQKQTFKYHREKTHKQCKQVRAYCARHFTELLQDDSDEQVDHDVHNDDDEGVEEQVCSDGIDTRLRQHIIPAARQHTRRVKTQSQMKGLADYRAVSN